MADYSLIGTPGIALMACEEIMANDTVNVANDLSENLFLVLTFLGKNGLQYEKCLA